jgi:HSP20 family molecular chaperone IbpA
MGQEHREPSVIAEDMVDENVLGIVMPGISERRLDVTQSRKRVRASSLNCKIKLKVENEEKFKDFMKGSGKGHGEGEGDRSPVAGMQTVAKGRIRTKGNHYYKLNT